MREHTRGRRRRRSSSTRYSRPDLSPTEYSAHTREASSIFKIELQGLQPGTRDITVDVKPTTPIRVLERVIRDHPEMRIKDSDMVILRRKSRFFVPCEPLGNDFRPLQYEIFHDPNDESIRPAQVLTATTTSSGVGEAHVATLPLPRATSKELTTVAEVRGIYARRRGVEDPNTIIVRLVGGLRPGPVEGDDWQLRRVGDWEPDDIIATMLLQPSYLVLCGYGKEYLYQFPCQDRDGLSVGNIKRWLRNSLIRCVHPTMRTRIPVDIDDISLYVDDELLSRDTSVVEWTAEVEFRLSPDVEMAFIAEEAWLCPSFECTLCQETIPKKPPTVSVGCDHEPTTCAPCIRRWVSTCLKDGWNKARCPQCSHPLAYDEVKAHASREDFEKYEMLSIRAALTDIPDFYWCLQKGCGSGQIHKPARGFQLWACPKTLFVCHACNGRQCTRHAMRWHEGLSCEEYERRNSPRLRQEKASEAAVKDGSKQCPGCSRSISKAEGCSHMTCVCGHEWCYLCLRPWTADPKTNIPYCNHRSNCAAADGNNPFAEQPRQDFPREAMDPTGENLHPPRQATRGARVREVRDLPHNDSGDEDLVEAYSERDPPGDRPQAVRRPRNGYQRQWHHTQSPGMRHSPRQDYRHHRGSTMPDPAYASPQFTGIPDFLHGAPASFAGPAALIPGSVNPRYDMRHNPSYWNMPPPEVYAPVSPREHVPNSTVPPSPDRRRRRHLGDSRSRRSDDVEERGQQVYKYKSTRHRSADVEQREQPRLEYQGPYSGVRYTTRAPPAPRRPSVQVPGLPVNSERRSAYSR